MVFVFHRIILVLLLCRSLLVVDRDDSDMSSGRARLIEVDAGSGGNGGSLTCRGNLSLLWDTR